MPTTDHDDRAPDVGSEATSPTQVPARGWWQVLRRAWRESTTDDVPVLAAAIAYYSFLSLFPALIAGISLYGLLVTPARAVQQAETLTSGLPSDSASIVTDQLTALGEQDSGALGPGFVVTVVLALWSASGGVATMVKALNIAYDETDERGFVRTRALALALTLGAIIFVVVSLTLVVGLPPLIRYLDLGTAGEVGLQVVRWVLLIALVALALAVVYRVAPDRADPRLRWVSPGALAASAVWLLGSVGFSLYVSAFGSYDETYGSLAGVAILLLWLYLTAFIVLMGAEINAESERQTLADTTTGPPRPRGEREAYVADEKPSEVR